MIKNLIIILALLSPLYTYSSSSNTIVGNINSKTFCKSAPLNECSHRSAPYIYKCGEKMCTKNKTECKEYLRAEKTLKNNQIRAILDLTAMSPLRNNNEINLQINFKKFESGIKDCTKKTYKWRPSDVCFKKRECFQKNSEFARLEIHFQVFKINCPCPKSKPYVCGSPMDYCALNKDVCDSFSLMGKIKNASAQLHAIQKCSYR